MQDEYSFGNLIGLEIVPYIILGLFIFYIFVVIPILVRRKNTNTKIVGNTYFESKTQYYLISLIGVILFGILYILNLGDERELYMLFEAIALTAFVFVSLYAPSVITLTNDGFTYIKGSKHLSAKWSEVKGIHFNPAPSIWAGVFHDFKSTSFIIETTNGVTGYIDKTTIKKSKNRFSSYSSGDEFLKNIVTSSKIQPTSGSYSELTTAKNKKMNWIIVIILLALIAFTFYYTTQSPFN
ncbi:MAG: hypothetical protein AAB895_02690 [Patescibacteria group bacterium]